jgi:HEAT repeat protein
MKTAALFVWALTCAAGLAASGSEVEEALRYGSAEDRSKALDTVLAGEAPTSGPAIMAVYGGLDAVDRVKAVRAFGILKYRKSEKAIDAALNDGDPQLRAAAATSLGLLGDKKEARNVNALLADTSPAVRAAAAAALGALGGREDIDALSACLGDKDEAVQEAAVRTLGALGDPVALPALKPLLAGPERELCRPAALAVGGLKGPEADVCLGEQLGSADGAQRAYAAEALANRRRDKDIEGALIGALEDPVYAVQVRAAQALGRWHSGPAVPGLLKALHSEKPTLRLEAVRALGAIRDRKVREALVYVRDHDREDLIRSTAKEALRGLR